MKHQALTGRPLEFMRRLLQAIQRDDLPGLASQCAFSLVFSFFAFVLLLLFVASISPFAFSEGVPRSFLSSLPADIRQIVFLQVQRITAGRHGAALTVAALVTLYSTSNGMARLVTAVNRAYRIVEQRPYWKRMGIGSLLTAAGLVLVFLPALWGTLGSLMQNLLPVLAVGPSATFVAWLRWPIMVAGAFGWLDLLFAVAPEGQHRWRPLSAGAFFAAIGLLLSNFGLFAYASLVTRMSVSYGALAGFLVLMLWLYIASFILITGAEVNAVLGRGVTRCPKAEVRLRQA